MTQENPLAGQGAVMLDIGGDVGALVVDMPYALEGAEVEIRPVGSVSEHSYQPHSHAQRNQHRPHVAVVARPADDLLVPSLVFPELIEGEYELYVKPAGEVRLTAQVRGGEVAHATWPR